MINWFALLATTFGVSSQKMRMIGVVTRIPRAVCNCQESESGSMKFEVINDAREMFTTSLKKRTVINNPNES